MTRGDRALLGACGLVLAVLFAVSWRAEPTRQDWALVLYVAAGALELLGALAVGYDLMEGHRRARVYDAQRRRVTVRPLTVRARALWNVAAVGTGHTPTLEERVAALEHEARGESERTRAIVDELRREVQEDVQGQITAVDRESRRRDEEVAGLIGAAGPGGVAWLGFGALLAGVLLGTVANIVGGTN